MPNQIQPPYFDYNFLALLPFPSLPSLSCFYKFSIAFTVEVLSEKDNLLNLLIKNIMIFSQFYLRNITNFL